MGWGKTSWPGKCCKAMGLSDGKGWITLIHPISIARQSVYLHGDVFPDFWFLLKTDYLGTSLPVYEKWKPDFLFSRKRVPSTKIRCLMLRVFSVPATCETPGKVQWAKRVSGYGRARDNKFSWVPESLTESHKSRPKSHEFQCKPKRIKVVSPCF